MLNPILLTIFSQTHPLAGFENWHNYIQTVKSSRPYPVLIPIPQIALSQPYRDVDLNLPQPYPDLIRTGRRSYPDLMPTLSAPYPNLIRTLSQLPTLFAERTGARAASWQFAYIIYILTNFFSC